MKLTTYFILGFLVCTTSAEEFSLGGFSFDASTSSSGGEYLLESNVPALSGIEISGGEFSIQGIAPIADVPAGLLPNPGPVGKKFIITPLPGSNSFKLLQNQKEITVFTLSGSLVWRFTRTQIGEICIVKLPEWLLGYGVKIISIR